MFKKKRKNESKFFCVKCEKIIKNIKQIKTRKNYTHGKNSTPMITKMHICGGLIQILK